MKGDNRERKQEVIEPPGDASLKEEKPTFRFVLLKAAAQLKVQQPDLSNADMTERSWDIFDETMYETIEKKIDTARKLERRPLLAKISQLADVLRGCQLPHKSTCPAGMGQGRCLCGSHSHNQKILKALTNS